MVVCIGPHGGTGGVRAFLSTVSSLYVGSRLGDSLRESGSVVMCLVLSLSFRGTRVLLAGRSGQQPAPSPCCSAGIVRPRGLFCLSAVVLMQFVLSYCSHSGLFYVCGGGSLVPAGFDCSVLLFKPLE